MNFLRTFLYCSMLFAMFACEKADFLTKDIPEDFPDAPPEMQKTALVHYVNGEGYSEEWFYDEKHRVLEETNTNGYYQKFYYDNGSIRQESFYDSSLQYVRTHTLNAQGYVVKTRQSYAGGDIEFTYDTEGHVTKETSKDALGNIRYASFKFIVSGNIVKDSTSNADGSWYVRTYTYPDSIPNTIASENFGQAFYGVENRHGWQTCAVKFSDGTSSWFNTIFQLDQDKRIIVRDRIAPTYQARSSYEYY